MSTAASVLLQSSQGSPLRPAAAKPTWLPQSRHAARRASLGQPLVRPSRKHSHSPIAAHAADGDNHSKLGPSGTPHQEQLPGGAGFGAFSSHLSTWFAAQQWAWQVLRCAAAAALSLTLLAGSASADYTSLAAASLARTRNLCPAVAAVAQPRGRDGACDSKANHGSSSSSGSGSSVGHASGSNGYAASLPPPLLLLQLPLLPHLPQAAQQPLPLSQQSQQQQRLCEAGASTAGASCLHTLASSTPLSSTLPLGPMPAAAGELASEAEDRLLEAARQVEARLEGVLGALAGGVPGVLGGQQGAEAEEGVSRATATAHTLIREVWEVVDANYLDARASGFDRRRWAELRDEGLSRSYRDTAAGYRAVRELLARGLSDPYCRFIGPSELAAMKKYDVSGVGLNLGTAAEYVVKTGKPLPGLPSPASTSASPSTSPASSSPAAATATAGEGDEG
ncbi:hypothetical protein Agub_g3187, partial [Astrephomene gubernaculifera]